jgi:hypothetical protein
LVNPNYKGSPKIPVWKCRKTQEARGRAGQCRRKRVGGGQKRQNGQSRVGRVGMEKKELRQPQAGRKRQKQEKHSTLDIRCTKSSAGIKQADAGREKGNYLSMPGP